MGCNRTTSGVWRHGRIVQPSRTGSGRAIQQALCAAFPSFTGSTRKAQSGSAKPSQERKSLFHCPWRLPSKSG
eukprot:6631482-Heterocapsa_arctica.AAC.1